MAAYSYKDVVHRADFEATKRRWEEVNGECDNDANYAGDYWCIAAQLLDEKDAKSDRIAAAIRAEQAGAGPWDPTNDVLARLLAVVEDGSHG